MPNRPQWDAQLSVGHALVDAQHQALLAQCNVLAEHCAAGDAAAFDAAFERLKALAREHCDTESTLLAQRAYPELDDHRFEFDEFEYLAAEIATAENFDRPELQRFLALWCVGHVTGGARELREFLAEAGAAA